MDRIGNKTVYDCCLIPSHLMPSVEKQFAMSPSINCQTLFFFAWQGMWRYFYWTSHTATVAHTHKSTFSGHLSTSRQEEAAVDFCPRHGFQILGPTAVMLGMKCQTG